MKNTLLLPRGFRIAGLVLLVPFLVLFFACINGNFTFAFLNTPINPAHAGDFLGGNHNLTDELAVVGCIASLYMIAFSRVRTEDEYVSFLRLRSLQIGVIANYTIFVVLTLLVYNGGYLDVLFFNIPTTLVLFIIVFYFNLHIRPLLTKTTTA